MRTLLAIKAVLISASIEHQYAAVCRESELDAYRRVARSGVKHLDDDVTFLQLAFKSDRPNLNLKTEKQEKLKAKVGTAIKRNELRMSAFEYAKGEYLDSAEAGKFVPAATIVTISEEFNGIDGRLKNLETRVATLNK